MKKYLLHTVMYILLLGFIVVIVNLLTNLHWDEIIFFVSGIAVFCAFFFSSSGDGFTRLSEANKTIETMGYYQPKSQKFKMSFNPFVLASILFLLFSIMYLFVL